MVQGSHDKMHNHPEDIHRCVRWEQGMQKEVKEINKIQAEQI